MSLCAACHRQHDDWFDYRLPPSVKIASGAAYDDTVAGVRDARRARYEQWRNLVRSQQSLIRRRGTPCIPTGPSLE